jgi:5-methylcytosine-specific restriction endonuclease McrA
VTGTGATAVRSRGAAVQSIDAFLAPAVSISTTDGGEPTFAYTAKFDVEREFEMFGSPFKLKFGGLFGSRTKKHEETLYSATIAQITAAGQTFNFDQWHDFSRQEPHPESIHTLSFKIRVPRVILLVMFDRLPKKEVKFTRHNIFERDRNTCQYCGKRFKSSECSIDHVMPQCQGGPSTWENCVLACVTCNVRKGGRTPKQANMKLVRTPVKPRWSPTFRARTIKPIWGKFGVNIEAMVSDLYWQVELEK